MNFVLQRADGSERKVSGYLRSSAPGDAKRFDVTLERLPPKVDLRPQMTAVEDQSSTNSCAANATAGAYEYLMKKHLGDDSYDVSRMFIYYNARAALIEAEGGALEDQGTTILSCMSALEQNGACSEGAWPFEEGRVNEAPDDASYEEARQFLIEGFEQVPTDLTAWKTALAAGYPIIFGLKLFDSFDKQKAKGVVPPPTPKETGRESHGGHAMLCVGYSDADEVFIVRNSWGSGWGDGGYCYVPYRYVMNQDYNFDDSWVVKKVDVIEGASPDEAGWGDEGSVLEEVSTALARMSDDEWTALLDAMGDSPFEQRMAALFLRAAAADGEASDEEVGAIVENLAPVYETLGIALDAERVLRKASQRIDDDGYIEESIDLLGAHLPSEALGTMLAQLEQVVGADGEIAGEEDDFLALLVQRWQLSDGQPADA